MKNKPKSIQIDRDKLRAAIRKLGSEYIFHMLDDAIDMLPQNKLHKVAKKYIKIERLARLHLGDMNWWFGGMMS